MCIRDRSVCSPDPWSPRYWPRASCESETRRTATSRAKKASTTTATASPTSSKADKPTGRHDCFVSAETHSAAHWDDVYAHGDTTRSWFQDQPHSSLRLFDAAGVSPHDGVIDVGGGASTLVDALLA